MSAVKLEFDALGIDVMIAGTQKAFALPPGTAIFTCSKAALARPPPPRTAGIISTWSNSRKTPSKA